MIKGGGPGWEDALANFMHPGQCVEEHLHAIFFGLICTPLINQSAADAAAKPVLNQKQLMKPL
jgi:hypothetical protein